MAVSFTMGTTESAAQCAAQSYTGTAGLSLELAAEGWAASWQVQGALHSKGLCGVVCGAKVHHPAAQLLGCQPASQHLSTRQHLQKQDAVYMGTEDNALYKVRAGSGHDDAA